MKVRVKALKRGTVVAPSTGHQVHFDPNAKRFPTARKPFVDERDVDYFVREGFAEQPSNNPRRYGDDHVREILREETRRPVDGEQAARRVAASAAADAKGGLANSGLDSRQTRNFAPGDGPGQDVELDKGTGDEGGEGGDGLDADDAAAPPAKGVKAPAQARPNPRRAAKKAAAPKS